MAKDFPLSTKKRGRRGQPPRGLGWTGFSAIFFVGGIAFLVWMLVYLVVPQWRVHYHFQQTTCQVVKTRLKQYAARGSVQFRPEFQIDFNVDGAPHREWATFEATGGFSFDEQAMQRRLERFAVGKRYPCWYDPHDASQVVLSRGYLWAPWLMLLMPLSFLAIGGGGLAYALYDWGKSAERRSAAASRGLQLETLEEHMHSGEPEFPWVPHDLAIADSPGTTLRYRLPVNATSFWALGGMLGAVILMNLMAALFLFLAVRKQWQGHQAWTQIAFTGPWLAVGAWAAIQVARRISGTTGIGPTMIEISHHPLHVGQTCQAHLSQWGRVKLQRLRWLLVCEEFGAYSQGTNLRTDARRVFEAPLYEADLIDVRPGGPFKIDRPLELPAKAMHSFRAPHNEVNWKFVVEGQPVGWPPFEREFPLVVRPAAGGAAP